MTDYPITPPPELVEQWVQATESNDCIGAFPTNFEKRICTAAARWGADMELEACCEWLFKDPATHYLVGREVRYLDFELRASRRPKPPSRKEQALEAVSRLCASVIHDDLKNDAAIVRRALSELPND